MSDETLKRRDEMDVHEALAHDLKIHAEHRRRRSERAGMRQQREGAVKPKPETGGND